MKRGRILNVALIVLGVIVLLSSFGGITGFSILEDVSGSVGSVIGIVLIVGGVLLLALEDKAEEANLSKSDRFILNRLAPADQGNYVPRAEEIENNRKTLGGEAKFYINPLQSGEVTYVHLTTSKTKAKRIMANGLKHGGKSTYGQALIFTGRDSYSKAVEFVDTLSSKEKYFGVVNPSNAIIFKTDVVPVINQFSGAIPRHYRGKWKAMFRYDLPRNLMEEVKNKSISA